MFDTYASDTYESVMSETHRIAYYSYSHFFVKFLEKLHPFLSTALIVFCLLFVFLQHDGKV